MDQGEIFDGSRVTDQYMQMLVSQYRSCVSTIYHYVFEHAGNCSKSVNRVRLLSILEADFCWGYANAMTMWDPLSQTNLFFFLFLLLSEAIKCCRVSGFALCCRVTVLETFWSSAITV